MAVYDRWHRKPKPGEQPCKEHSRGKTVLYASAEHGRGDRWQVRWYDDDGKQCKENLPLKEGRDPARHADARDREVQGQLQAGTYVDPAAGKVTLKAYAKEWVEAQTCDEATLEDYERWLRLRIEPAAIGRAEIAALSKKPSAIQKWVKGLQDEGLGPRTIGVQLTILSMVFNAAIEDGIISRNPCRSKTVRPPEADKREIAPATYDETEALREALPDHLKAMVDCGYGAGMRVGEIIGVGKDDIGSHEIAVVRQIRLVRKALVFSPPKRGKTRTVPIDEETSFRLIAHMNEHEPVTVALPWKVPGGELVEVALVFTRPGPDGGRKPMSQSAAEYWFRKAARAAGLPDEKASGWHWLRHTFASVCLAGGIDVLKVARWLGHRSAATTLAYYAHFIPDVEDLISSAMKAFRKTKIQKRGARNVP